jgi:hypothetical protein
VKEEIAILAKEEGLQNVSEDHTVELLESLSLQLMNEEMAGCGGGAAAASSSSSKETTLRIIRFKRKLEN